MNFYKHHIGDFAQATAHLSFVEDAAYSRMLRKYYAEEKPLPVDVKAVQRLIGARTKEERESVQVVLDEFFDLADDGWHNKRADEELGKANAQADTNRRIAEEREVKRRARLAAEAAAAALNGSSNETLNGSSHEALHESSAVREPSQTPDTRHQTPDKRTPPAPAPESRFPQFWAAWPKSPRKGGKPECLKVWQAKDLEREAPTILRHVRSLAGTEGWTKQGGEYVPAPVVYLRGRRWDGAEAAATPDPTDWRTSRDGVIRQGIRLGLGPYEELDHSTGQAIPWESYRRRVLGAHNAKEPDHAQP